MSLTRGAISALPQVSIVGASLKDVENTFGVVFLGELFAQASVCFVPRMYPGYCFSTIAYGFTYFRESGTLLPTDKARVDCIVW